MVANFVVSETDDSKEPPPTAPLIFSIAACNALNFVSKPVIAVVCVLSVVFWLFNCVMGREAIAVHG